jgi:hypothetical protein
LADAVLADAVVFRRAGVAGLAALAALAVAFPRGVVVFAPPPFPAPERLAPLPFPAPDVDLAAGISSSSETWTLRRERVLQPPGAALRP